MLRPYNRLIFRHGDVVGQRRAAELAQVDIEDDVRFGAHGFRHAGGSIELCGVPLAVAKRQRVAVETFGPRNRQGRRGIEPA